jgi:hypothetical protein
MLSAHRSVKQKGACQVNIKIGQIDKVKTGSATDERKNRLHAPLRSAFFTGDVERSEIRISLLKTNF